MLKKLFNSLNRGIIAIYILTFMVIPLLQLVAYIALPSIFEDEAALTSFSAGLNLFWYLTLTVILFRFAWIYLFKNQWVYFTKNLRRSILLVLLGLMLMFAMNMFINTGFAIFDLEIASENQAALEEILMGRTFDMIAIVIFAGLLAPIAEEIVFRKGVYGIIHKRAGNLAAILGSGILFGLIHMTSELTNVAGMIPYFGLGIVLSYIYYFSSKMIFVPILVHGVMNIIAIAGLIAM